MIESSFAKREEIHTIEHEYALLFLKLGEIQINAFIKSELDNEDVITNQAQTIVIDFSSTECAVLFLMI